MKLFHPEVFQGNVKAKRYFEGWYFKHVSADRGHVYSFIPGISLAPHKKHAFIQVINGVTGETRYIEYDLREFSAARDRLQVRVGASLFTDRSIELSVEDKGFNVSGRIEYVNSVRYPRSLAAPGIMGWYSYIPFMECNHGVVSVHHSLRGELRVNGKAIDFNDGKGYIEKDWGRSFPEAWIWLQCNTFSVAERSLFFSIAKIPWLGGHFAGFISFLFDQGAFYVFATYNGSKKNRIELNGNLLSIQLENKQHVLNIQVKKLKEGELAAPVQGAMTRRIKESVDSEVQLQLCDKAGRVVVEDAGKRAGLEIMDKIFESL
jgi:tocopherol cyclase